MQIPLSKAPGSDVEHPTVSPTQLRCYGAGGFRLAEQEQARGCPRQYHAKYVERRVPDRQSYALEYGRVFHQVLYLMEQDGLNPEEALDRAFPAHLEPEVWTELRADLDRYLERGTAPVDRFASIAVEQDLHALLYEDEDYGPIWFRGIVDWIGIDPEVPDVLHVVDYKTNRTPPSLDDVRGDVQLKAYAWLVAQHWATYMGTASTPRVVVHLDAVKWRDVEVVYTPEEIDDWHSWVVAVVRVILRDEDAAPRLNPGCAWCPVKDDCPEYEGLPDMARNLLTVKPAADERDDVRLAWRDRANATRLLLEKAVKEVDADFQARTRTLGSVETAQATFSLEPDWADQWDMRALHDALGDGVFYQVVSSSKTKVNAVIKQWPSDEVAPVLAAMVRVPVGSKVVRKAKKVSDG